MELQNTTEYRTQKYSSEETVRVNHKLSRSKALMQEGDKVAVPSEESIDVIYELYHKIGADRELPVVIDKNHKRGIEARKAYIADFWRTIYLQNNLCPGDIPFDIIFREFTTAMVQNRVERKGNNQAALCQAFNAWISQTGVRNRLYHLRDQAYPENKPKQVAENATRPTIRDYSDDQLKEKLKAIKPMAGLKTADAMIAELEEEIKRRTADQSA